MGVTKRHRLHELLDEIDEEKKFLLKIVGARRERAAPISFSRDSRVPTCQIWIEETNRNRLGKPLDDEIDEKETLMNTVVVRRERRLAPPMSWHTS
jgi:hypothetical protein